MEKPNNNKPNKGESNKNNILPDFLQRESVASLEEKTNAARETILALTLLLKNENIDQEMKIKLINILHLRLKDLGDQENITNFLLGMYDDNYINLKELEEIISITAAHNAIKKAGGK